MWCCAGAGASVDFLVRVVVRMVLLGTVSLKDVAIEVRFCSA